MFKSEIKKIVQERLQRDIVLIVYRGSIAHNMYIPSEDPDSIDDVDAIAVYMSDPEAYLSLAHGFPKGVQITEGKYDIVAYEFRKFVYLLTKANPNVLSALWVKPEHQIMLSPLIGKKLIDMRKSFITQEIFNTFGGYARSQLKKMTHFVFQGYMGEKRKCLVEKHGYDTKNAAHLIRLLKMATESLQNGEMNVYRHDAKQLLKVKTGALTLEEVKNSALALEADLKEAARVSELPKKADLKMVNKFVFNALLDYINKGIY